MKMTAILLLAGIVGVPAVAAAQIKTLPGDAVSVTATVEAIERSTRSVTLKGPEGKLMTVTAPSEMKRFDELKVGDSITARYYDNVVLRVKRPEEKDVNTTSESLTPGKGPRPGATVSAQRTITARITAIDASVASITFAGPNNWTYSTRVADKAALQQVKVGDRLDITWTEAMMVSVDAVKK